MYVTLSPRFVADTIARGAIGARTRVPSILHYIVLYCIII
jgi:3-deoxy-D-arabino-heptulosonate 7-phosphate (DAHP) synthase